MTPAVTAPSTGIDGLDETLCGLILGDNVVWEVESVDDYAAFVAPFLDRALQEGREVYYFRFARHAPVMAEDRATRVVHLDPQVGFETFLTGVHRAVEEASTGAYHVFDSLSDLAADWYSDQMLGNFFELTCPRLYELETIAYFGLLRNLHSSYATVSIANTTQLLLGVYRHHGQLHIQPLKVSDRSSPTMYMLHALDGGAMHPVTESTIVAEILTASPRSPLGLSQQQMGVWTHTLVEAEALLEEERADGASAEAVDRMFIRLLRMIISRDDRVLRLARRCLTLGDLISIGKRLLGTGLIGGKSVGMLLARAILQRTDERWADLLEVHDSFFIPSDVFYTYLVRNRCWELRRRRLSSTDYLEGASEARQSILKGVFPEHIRERFSQMLDYFGQSPIIVRSSSLLEDNFGNSFAGKYESVFCVNQGSPQKRLDRFILAVKTVYASTMSDEALSYRARHNLLERDEQMALLVQRVSGAFHGPFFYPALSGVGLSFNPYVWSDEIDPEAGMLRLVFGLGTRAVDRSDDDYTRIVALNAPDRRPEVQRDDVQQYAQHRVDLLELSQNKLATAHFDTVAEQRPDIPMDLFAAHQGRRGGAPLALTFDGLLSRTAFISDMRDMARILEEAYEYPVEFEFTVNFASDKTYKVNLLQCRPFQFRGGFVAMEAPEDIGRDQVLLESTGPVIGQSRIEVVERIIYVNPSVYGQLPIRDRYSVARLIGRLTHLNESEQRPVTMLLGPGRWGTTTPSLGVPVCFAEINTVSILCEIVAMRDDLIPDVSLGTHFFSELVEVDTLYVALFPDQPGSFMRPSFFEGAENRLLEFLPDAGAFENVVRVIDLAGWPGGQQVELHADTVKQRVLTYFA